MATILGAALAFRQMALAREESAAREIVRVYAIAQERIAAQVSALLDEYRRVVLSGQTPSVDWLMRADRALMLYRAVQFETGSAAMASETIIRDAQAQMVELAANSTREMLGAADIRDVFRPPLAALDQLVGNLGDGSPLRRLFDRMPLMAGQQVEKALIQGIATGANPRETARMMRAGVGGVIDSAKSRTLTISRTETMRVHRDASLENFKANRAVLQGWVWVCACDLRSCPSCWAMHGTFHDFREVFGSHPNCRCGPLPQVRGLPALIPEDQAGAARFDRLSEEDQLQVLGPKKHELYQSGRIRLEDMTVKTYDRSWGPQRHEATIAESLANAGEKRKAA